jgi:chromosomal replication initiation ATPase DnaA
MEQLSGFGRLQSAAGMPNGRKPTGCGRVDEAKEHLEKRYRLQAQGYDLDKVTMQVSSELGIGVEQVWAPGKHPQAVKARSLLCYWAVRKLGFSATELSKKLGISQPAVSLAVKRGEKIAQTEQLELAAH